MPIFNLRPRADGVTGAGWAFGGAGSFGDYRNVDPGATLAHDDGNTYVEESAFLGNGYTVYTTALPGNVLAIRSVKVAYRLIMVGGAGTTVRMNLYAENSGGVGAVTLDTGAYSSGTYYTAVLPGTGSVGRPGGGDWTVDDLRDTTLRVGLQNVANPASEMGVRVTSLYFIVDAIADPAMSGMTNDVMGRALRARRRPLDLVNVRGPIRWLNPRPLDPMYVSDLLAPSPDGTGDGLEKWKRRPFVILTRSLNLDNREAELLGYGGRMSRVRLWDSDASREQVTASYSGTARMSIGARSFARASKAWIESPSAEYNGSRLVVPIDTDMEKIEASGLLIEGAATNNVLHSSFDSGLTGWTASATGTTPATSTDVALFSDDVTSNVIKFNPSSLATDHQIVTSAAVSAVSATVGCFSFDHLDQTGHALYYKVTRASDGRYWDDATGTFVVPATWNAMDVSRSWHRHRSKAVGNQLAGTTCLIYVGVPTTGTVGQVNYLAHVQYEDHDFPSSRVVTSGTTTTRAADDLYMVSEHDRQIWHRDRGTIMLEVKMEAPSANMPQLAFFSIHVDDAEPSSDTNSWRLFHSGSGGTLTARKRVQSTNYSATYAKTWAAGDTIKLAFRWRSTEREYAESADALATNYSFDLFIDGVSVAEYALGPNEFLKWFHLARFRPGSYWDGSALTDHMFGWIKRLEVYDYVLTKYEIADAHK